MKLEKNEESEEVLAEAKFEVPAICDALFLIIVFIIVGALIFYFIVYSFFGYFGKFMAFLPFLIVFAVIIMPVMFNYYFAATRNKCIITNKRIYGVNVNLFSSKNYSYRFDEIDNIEIKSTLGIRSLNIQFTQGNGTGTYTSIKKGVSISEGNNLLSVKCISNNKELYDVLSNILCSVKNDKDVQVDIEMTKVDLEERKAKAFESMASNMNGDNKKEKSDYIKQIKELKELADAGIITQEEFENKKKDLLERI